MPTRKVRDIKEIDRCDGRAETCRHPEHNPPNMRVWEPGEYEHECPGCGRKFTFFVHRKHWCHDWKSDARKTFSKTLNDEIDVLKRNMKGRDYDAFNEGFKSGLHFALSKI